MVWWWASLAWADPVVFVPLDGWVPVPPAAAAPAVPVLLNRREVTVRPGAESAVTVRWTLRALAPGWVDVPLLPDAVPVAAATIDGRPVALAPGPDHRQHLALWLDGDATVAVSLAVATPTASLSLDLAPAARQAVTVLGPVTAALDGAVRVPAPDAAFVGGPAALSLQWAPIGPAPARPPLVRAEVAAATAVDAGGRVSVAQLRYRVVRGSWSSLDFDLPPVDDLEVTGDGVVGVRRVGDRVSVDFSRPVEDRAVLDVRYRTPTSSDPALLTPWPVAAEPEGWLTVLRTDHVLVAPEAGPGAAAVASAALPDWASGLQAGTPVARFRLTGDAPAVAARVVDWEPIDGPPTVVDEARYEVAYADHGRLLFRARFQVRNDRRQFLRVAVPEGLELIAATVAGRMVQPARDAEGRLLVPLEKSIETMEGLVRFPVDISFWGVEAAWTARGTRTLATPWVDAPVAYARWEAVLPPGIAARRVDSRAAQVAAWSSGASLVHGRAVAVGGDAPAADDADQRRDQSQVAWNEAYAAYKDSRFSAAASLLERSLALDPANAAARQLQSNLDVLVGGAPGKADSAEARRVRELARAKTLDAEIAQSALQAEADAAIRAGDYGAAASSLAALAEVSGVLAAVEQSEASDKKEALTRATAQVDAVRAAAARKQRATLTVASPAPEAPALRPPPAQVAEWSYDGDEEDLAAEVAAVPLRAGEATVIDHDGLLSAALADGLVIEPDLYALLTADDLVWTGEEGLHTEVVVLGASGWGSGGSGSGYGAGVAGAGVAGRAAVAAVLPGVHIPRAGAVLQFESRLLAPGESLTAHLRLRRDGAVPRRLRPPRNPGSLP